MKNANFWVIFSMIAVSLALGFLAPVDGQPEQRTRSHAGNGSDLASGDACAPFVGPEVRYAGFDLSVPAGDRRFSIEF
jgi:hypothetical protein